MKSSPWAHILAAGIAIPGLSFLIQAQNREQPALRESTDRIVGIVIRGNQRIAARDIRKMIPIKPGDVYDPAKVEATAEALRRSGKFDEVVTRVSEDPDGSRGGTFVLFQVHEKQPSK